MVSLYKDFPSQPVNVNIISVLYGRNPNIKFNKDVVDFIPPSIRKKAGIKFTIVDLLGLIIWKILITVLMIFVLIIVIAILLTIAMFVQDNFSFNGIA